MAKAASPTKKPAPGKDKTPPPSTKPDKGKTKKVSDSAGSPAMGRSPYMALTNVRQFMSDHFEAHTSEALNTGKNAVQHDYTLAQFELLNAVRADEGLNQTQIVERTGMDRSTVAEVARRMVQRGFIARQRTAEDERAYALKLTPAGIEMHSIGYTAMTKLESLLAGVPGYPTTLGWASRVLELYGTSSVKKSAEGNKRNDGEDDEEEEAPKRTRKSAGNEASGASTH
jgi:DNA-binding MarR family transcriptional regulator